MIELFNYKLIKLTYIYIYIYSTDCLLILMVIRMIYGLDKIMITIKN